MFGHKFARAFLASTAIVGTGFALPAMAQLVTPAPVRQSIDANGVDLFLGTMNADGPTLSAGRGDEALSYRWTNRGAGWTDDQTAGMNLSGTIMTVAIGPNSETFSVSGSTYISTEGSGNTLTYNSTTHIYTYTLADGTIYHFNKNLNSSSPYFASDGRLVDVVRPDGFKTVYAYTQALYCKIVSGGSCTQYAPAYRIDTIRNSAGYKLTFSYYTDTIEDTQRTPGQWATITGVGLSNLAVSGSGARSQSYDNQTIAGTLQVTDPMGRLTKYRTNVSLAGITLPDSASEDVTVTYTSGKVSAVTTPVGTTNYAYSDATGIRTVTVTNPASKVATYTFDISSSRMKSMTDATGKQTQWQYDSSGRVTRVTAPEGNYTQYTYDGRGNVTETRNVAKSGSGLADIVATAAYDSTCTVTVKCNKPNSTTDPRSNTTDYTYDSTTGQLLTVTAPAATAGGIRPKTTYTYTSLQAYFDGGSGIVASGEPVSMLTGISACQTTASCTGTADEAKTVIDYGPQTAGTGNNLLPVSKTNKAGDNSLTATIAMGYDAVGNVTTVDGPLSGPADTTTYRYDDDRERTGAISADPDGAGALKRKAVRTTYSPRGIVTEQELGTVTGTDDTAWAAFNSLQQVTTTLDAAGRKAKDVLTASGTTYGVTQYSYDTVGRPECTAIRMNTALWGSLPASACTLQTAGSDGPDRISKTSYDDAGRPTMQIAALGIAGTESNDATATYSDNGQIATLVDAEGNKTSYTYDGFDRLSKTNYPSATKGSGTSSTTDYELLGYDANGNVTSRLLRGAALTINYTYDNLNRLKTKDLPGTEPDVTYGYDLLGQLTSASTSAQTLSFTYDALGRNLAQMGPLGTVGYQYDPAGRRIRLTWPDLFYVTYDYLVTGEMTTVKESGTTTLGTYAYDDLGRRASLTRGNGVVTSYGYDNVSRLTSLASDLPGTTYDLTLGFGYNQASQITSTTRSNNLYSWTGATNVARNYTSNGLNQYSANTSTAFGYDARGNLTSSGSNIYTYSSENLLLTGPNSATLTYDPLMRLFQSSGATTTDTKDLYDGDQLIALYITSTGALAQRYVMGPRPDEPLLVYKSGGVKYWVITDERGSTISDADSSGTPQVTNTYDEYGIPGASNALRMQYTGQVLLPELGMYYYKARIYSPTLGRFMQTDPVGYGDGMNWYNYAGSDPTNIIDPTGHLRCYTLLYYSHTGVDTYPRALLSKTVCEYDGAPDDEVTMEGSPRGPFVHVPQVKIAPCRVTSYPVPKGYVSADAKINRYIKPIGAPAASPPVLNPAYEADIKKQRASFNSAGVFWDLLGITAASATGGIGGAGVSAGEAGMGAGAAGIETGRELAHAQVCPK